MKTFVSLITLFFLTTPLLWAQALDQACTQEGAGACIDWDRQMVIAEGAGAPSSQARSQAQKNATAERAARLDAARNALEMLQGINLTSSTTMKDAMLSDDTIRTRVQGKLYGLRTVGTPRFFSDGSVKIRVEASLRQIIPDDLYRAATPPTPVPGPEAETGGLSTQIDPSRIYTGLVIDARGTGLQPAMSPKVLDESGRELYGSAYVEAEFVKRHGMAGYVKDPEQASTNDRVEGSPLMIKAVSASGVNQTDVVVRDQDANSIRKLAKSLNFLKEARVVMVLD